MVQVFMKGHIFDITEERTKIAQQMMEQEWFFNTSVKLLMELLLELPEKFNGFLADLAQRPDEVGGVKVLKLNELWHSNFSAVAVFTVRNSQGKEYSYEYHSWAQGPMSGAKGIVFVRTGEEITHFIVLRGEKFAPGKMVWDLVGGFMEEVDAKSINPLLSRISTEVQEELGVPELVLEHVVDLGHLMPDAGMTNNSPMLFAAVIDASDADKVSSDPVNPDQYELKAGAHVFPMSQLKEQVLVNDDAYFQATVLRSMAEGIISPALLML